MTENGDIQHLDICLFFSTEASIVQHTVIYDLKLQKSTILAFNVDLPHAFHYF